MEIPGSSILNLNKSRQRARYWRQVGDEWIETLPLPADALSINHYFSKGFKPTRPVEGKVEKMDGIQCPLCEFGAKSAFGLASHLRKHKEVKDG